MRILKIRPCYSFYPLKPPRARYTRKLSAGTFHFSVLAPTQNRNLLRRVYLLGKYKKLLRFLFLLK